MSISRNLERILENAGNSSLVRFVEALGKIPEWALISLNALSEKIMENFKKIEEFREEIKSLKKKIEKLEEKNQALEVQLKYLQKKVEGDF